MSCSSLGAIVTPAKSFGDETDDVTYTPEHRVPDSYYSSMSETVPEYYSRGKTFALNATDRLAQDELHFDLINIFPSSVIGRSEIANTTKELLSTSNYRGLAIALGRKEQPVPTACVHADDLAKMHIDVLKFDTPKYSNFGGGIQMSFQDQTNIIREHFPQEVANGTFSMDGELPDRPFIFDCSSTEQFFNWKFKSFEEQVKDVAEQYLELLEKEKSK